jgi:hypothetical protein
MHNHVYPTISFVFQNPRAERYKVEDFRSLTEVPTDFLNPFGEEQPDEIGVKGKPIRERFYLGRISSVPRFSSTHNAYLFKLNRLYPLDVTDAGKCNTGVLPKVRWEEAKPAITDTVTENSIIGLVLPDEELEVVSGVLTNAMRYVFRWLNPYSVACFPLKPRSKKQPVSRLRKGKQKK